ncbi:MAG: bifunctional (p)ppGpp synthetase/guanosine-3',5'-bis(diphosphate) 3'-pyrophosphohydrolase, partial [Rickettsiales bacterium]|nr:bifunctional (p)ppGpp synthetase/guanosine-3',5'-bis(diphosphate) 3'-pyrophosphohydrolase [Rickettsiales bacterium]
KASDKARLELAYTFSQEKHLGQKRDSGESYFSHPLEVAVVCAEQYEMDIDSVIAALLHDVIEDTETSIKTIENLFGSDVADLVVGLTKLRSLKIKSETMLKAENYRNFVISVSKDIRVLIIKLIDRHHNMMTLDFKQREKKQRIALETLNIYIPLAERMGMENIKHQMETVCFRELYPQEYHYIQEKLENIRQRGTDLIEPIVDELSDLTFRHKIKAKIFGREKNPYSIWRKMQIKNISFDDIFDIIAFRFLVNTVEDCYKILGMIHSTYKMVPNRFKDYISTPKPNKYQSLHTTVIGPQKNRIEVQIRTYDMDRIAQYGYAAHWLYKQGNRDISSHDFDWLRNMANAVKNISSSDEIVEHTSLTQYVDSIFCFTPKGDLMTLPIGATALDFAYEIHSNIGNHCVGAKVNKIIKNIRTPLNTGDEVEILTSKNQNPSPEWERFVVTAKAKSSIRHYLKQQKKSQIILYGKQLLQAVFENYKKDFHEKELSKILDKYGASGLDDLYLLVGTKEYTPEHVLFSIYPELRDEHGRQSSFNIDDYLSSVVKNGVKKEHDAGGVLSNIPIHFAKCCYPVPGDEIVGIIHTGMGFTIHRKDCKSLKRYEYEPERVLSLTWNDYTAFRNSAFQTKLSILATHKPGALNEITAVIAKADARIDDIKVTSKTSDYIEFFVVVEVKDIDHLNGIINNLKGIKVINTVLKYEE